MDFISSWYLKKMRKSDGRILMDQTGASNGSVAPFDPPVKVSVDAGSFEPGTYRVNPYSISSGAVLEPEFDSEFDSGFDSTSTAYNWEFGCTHENLFLGSMKATLLSYLSLNPSPPNSSWGRTQALQKARSSLSGQMMSYGVETGEFKETVQFLLHPLKTLQKLFSGRMIFGGPKEKLSRLTDAYLQYRFALQPFLGTVSDTIDLIRKGLPSFEAGKIYSHHGLVKDKTSQAGPLQCDFNTAYLYYRTLPTISEELKFNSSVQCVYDVPPGLFSMLGLHFLDVPSIVWELTRLSFIIDRYIAIGPWIDSLRYQPQAHILGGTSAVRRSITVKPSVITRRFYYAPSYVNTDLKGSCVKWESYDRVVEDELLTMPAINFGLSKSVTQVIDEIVLILKAVK